MRKITACILLSGLSGAACAGPWGNDFGLSFNPIAGGMGAATYANPQSASDAVFGNPATLMKLADHPNTITFGAAYVNIDFTLDHDGSVAGAPFSAKSDTQHFLIPNVAVARKIGNDMVIGGGLGITAGLGSDFRTDTLLSPAINYIAFANNISIAKQIDDHWSIGATMTLGYGLLDIGPIQSGGTVSDVNLRGAFGVGYDLENVSISLHYNSALKFDFDNAFLSESTPTSAEFADLALEQPQEVVLGWSYRFHKDWDWQAAVMYKNWEDADGYQDIWEDQYVFVNGFQYSQDKWDYRFGFGFTNDIRKEELGSTFGGKASLGFQAGTVPLSPPVLEFLQASLAPSFWTNTATAGFGYAFSDVVRVDAFIGYVFGSEERISDSNQTDVDFLQGGAGFTWTF